MKTLRDINKALKPHNVRLFRGRNLYMTYDTGESLESKTFYGSHFASRSPERWVEAGIDFADRCFLKVRENV
jgi:hypothetical protein